MVNTSDLATFSPLGINYLIINDLLYPAEQNVMPSNLSSYYDNLVGNKILPEEMEALTTAIVNFGHQSNSAKTFIYILLEHIERYSHGYGFKLYEPKYKTSVDNLRKILKDPSFEIPFQYEEWSKECDDLKIIFESKGNKILKQYIKTLLN